MIGNSFSVDCIQYVYEIATAAGVKNIKLGNLFISGCTLKMHLENAVEDKAAYTYYTNDSGKWVTTKSYKMSDAIKSEDWDFISFQQASGKSTKPDTYDDLELLMPLVEELCTNPKVEFIWHMTWAYRGDSVSAAYDNDQMTMYEAVVDAVKEKIVPNTKIKRIVPSGTSIQNARSSYLGDTLNRDEYHLSKVEGRIIAGIAMVMGIDSTALYFGLLSGATLGGNCTPIGASVILPVSASCVRKAMKFPMVTSLRSAFPSLCLPSCLFTS
jgi:hypothetical protein